jgi:hypothetical protein
MIDETSLEHETRWRYERLAAITVKNMKRRNIHAQYITSRKEALTRILELIPRGVTVGRGDSMTLDQIGIFPELKKRKQNLIYDPFERDSNGKLVIGSLVPGAGLEEHVELERKAMMADVFLASSNAVTLDGKLVSTDGHGNRVAPMLFGPKKVILVVGANKIVRNLDEALDRIRAVAAPMNVKRHVLKHHSRTLAELPCARSGICTDCHSPGRICNKTVIIEAETTLQSERTHVVIIGEALGI